MNASKMPHWPVHRPPDTCASPCGCTDHVATSETVVVKFPQWIVDGNPQQARQGEQCGCRRTLQQGGGHLHERAAGEAGADDGLGGLARDVGAAAVHLGRVLAAERAAAVRALQPVTQTLFN